MGESDSHTIMAYCYDRQIWGNGGMITGKDYSKRLERVAPVVLHCTWVSLGEKLVTDFLSYGMDYAINWVPTVSLYNECRW